MKNLHRWAVAVASAAFFIASPASAQWQVQNHAFPIGKGAGTGFTSLLCGSAQLAVGQTAADPICVALSGDATMNASGVVTFSTVNSNVGSFGSATQCVAFTVNAKGLITAASQATCTPAIGSVTGLGTGVATALAINVGTAGAVVVNGGALGTPASGTLTNATGLPIAGITGLGTNVATGLATATGANNGFPRIIATGTIALGTGAISATTCASAVTSTATGTATTDVIELGFNSDPTGVTGYTPGAMLTIIPYPTTNTVNVKVCNNTSSSITPGAVTLNWRVVR